MTLSFWMKIRIWLVLMTVKELEILLSKKMDIQEFIWTKVRALAEEGDFNKFIVM